MDKIMVGIAEGKIARKTQVLASYALGSCVAICLYDPKNKIAGMAHAILPRKEDAVDQGNPYKFAREGASELIRAMVNSGAEKKQITAKPVGGARMFKTRERDMEIGARNVMAAKEALHKEGVSILAEDTGKNYGRTVFFHAEDGRIQVSTIKKTTIVI